MRRKNFLPTLIVTFILWILTVNLVYFIDPETTFALPGFFLLIFLIPIHRHPAICQVQQKTAIRLQLYLLFVLLATTFALEQVTKKS